MYKTYTVSLVDKKWKLSMQVEARSVWEAQQIALDKYPGALVFAVITPFPKM